MICKACENEFFDGCHLGVPLTIVCSECVTSDELLTKTDALSLGASQSDLSGLRRLYAPNPHYRNGAEMQLFVLEEVDVYANIAVEKKRRAKEKAERKRVASELRQQSAKKTRLESLEKRMKGLDGVVPTPGLVSGDFCTTEVKNPKVGVRNLLARRALWNRLSGVEIPRKTMVFRWAVVNRKLSAGPAILEEGVEHDSRLFDRVATVEGHRILSCLDGVDRGVLLRLNPVLSEQVFDLPVEALPDNWIYLCDKVAGILGLPFGRVFAKLRDSEGCWLWRYMFSMRPKRVACIIEPHFLTAPKRNRLLLRDMEESFERWGLSKAERNNGVDYRCKYFRGDVVDVELYSAICAILKAAIPHGQAVHAVTNKVMSTPGATWMAVTKRYIGDQLAIRRETSLMRREDKRPRGRGYPLVCACGNQAARDCPFGRCGHCCSGPCARHGR